MNWLDYLFIGRTLVSGTQATLPRTPRMLGTYACRLAASFRYASLHWGTRLVLGNDCAAARATFLGLRPVQYQAPF